MEAFHKGESERLKGERDELWKELRSVKASLRTVNTELSVVKRENENLQREKNRGDSHRRAGSSRPRSRTPVQKTDSQALQYSIKELSDENTRLKSESISLNSKLRAAERSARQEEVRRLLLAQELERVRSSLSAKEKELFISTRGNRLSKSDKMGSDHVIKGKQEELDNSLAKIASLKRDLTVTKRKSSKTREDYDKLRKYSANLKSLVGVLIVKLKMECSGKDEVVKARMKEVERAVRKLNVESDEISQVLQSVAEGTDVVLSPPEVPAKEDEDRREGDLSSGELAEKLAEAEKQAKDAAEELDRKEKAFSTLEERNTELNSSLTEIEAQLDDEKAKNQNQTEELRKVKADLEEEMGKRTEKENELAHLKENFMGQQLQLSESRKEVEKKDLKISTLMKKVEQAKIKEKSLGKQLQAAEVEHNRNTKELKYKLEQEQEETEVSRYKVRVLKKEVELLKSEMEIAERSNKENSRKLNERDSKLKLMHSMASKMNIRDTDSKEILNKLNQRIQDLETSMSKLKGDLEASHVEIATLKGSLVESNENREHLELSSSSLSKKLEEKNSENSALEARARALETDFEDVNKELEEQKSATEKVIRERNKIKKDLEFTRLSLSDAQTALEDSGKKESSVLKRVRVELEKAVDTKDEAESNLRKNKEELSSALISLEEEREKRKDASKSLSAAQEDLQSSKKEYSALKAKYEELLDKKERELNESLRKGNEQIETAISELTVKEKKVEKLQEKVNTLSDEGEKKDKVIEHLQRTVQSLERKKENELKHAFERQKENVSKQEANAKGKEQEFRREKELLEAEIVLLKEESERALGDAQRLEKEVSDASEGLELSGAEVRRLKEENEKLRADKSDMQVEVAEMRSSMDIVKSDARKEVEAQSERSEEYIRIVREEYDSQIEKLQKELENERDLRNDEADILTEEVDIRGQEAKKLREEKEREVEKARKQFEIMRVALEAKVAAAEEEAAEAKATIRAKAADLESELVSKDERKELMGRIKSLETDLEEQKRLSKSLNEDNERAAATQLRALRRKDDEIKILDGNFEKLYEREQKRLEEEKMRISNAEVDDQSALVEKLREEIADLKDDLNDRIKESTQHSRTISDLIAKVGEHARLVRAEKEEREGVQSKLEIELRENKRFKEILAEKEKEIEKKRSEFVANDEAAPDEVAKSANAYMRQIEQMKGEIGELKHENSLKERKNTTAIDSLRREKQLVEDDLRKSEASYKKRIKELENELEEQHERLTGQLSSISENTKKEIETLRRKKIDIAKEKKRLENTLSEAENAFKEKDDDLRAKLNEISSLQSEKEIIIEECNNFKKEMRNLVEERERKDRDFKVLVDTNKDLEAKLVEAEGQITESSSDSGVLNAEINKLKADFDDASAQLADEKQNVSSNIVKIDEMEEENSRLRERSERIESKFSEQEKAIRELSSENSELARRSDSLEGKYSKLKNKKRVLEDEIDALKSALEKLKAAKVDRKVLTETVVAQKAGTRVEKRAQKTDDRRSVERVEKPLESRKREPKPEPKTQREVVNEKSVVKEKTKGAPVREEVSPKKQREKPVLSPQKPVVKESAPRVEVKREEPKEALRKELPKLIEVTDDLKEISFSLDDATSERKRLVPLTTGRVRNTRQRRSGGNPLRNKPKIKLVGLPMDEVRESSDVPEEEGDIGKKAIKKGALMGVDIAASRKALKKGGSRAVRPTGLKKVRPKVKRVESMKIDLTTQLWKVKGVRGKMIPHRIPLSSSEVANDSVFVLLKDDGQIFQFEGKNAGRMKKAKALDMSQTLRSGRGARGSVSVLPYDTESSKFWSCFPDKKPASIPDSDGLTDAEFSEKYTESMKLWKCEEVPEESLADPSIGEVRLVETKAVQSSLGSEFVYILDCSMSGETYCWSGRDSSMDLRHLALGKANEIALGHKDEFPWAWCSKEHQSGETKFFIDKFSKWVPFERKSAAAKMQSVGSVKRFGGGAREITSLSSPGKSRPKKRALNMKDVYLSEELYELTFDVVREEKTENVFDEGSSKVEVWVVEKGRESAGQVEFPRELHGHFFSGNSFLILYRYTDRERDRYMVFYWIGNGCSKMEKGSVSLLATELDTTLGREAVEVTRIVEGHETSVFLNAFGGKCVVHRGNFSDVGGNTSPMLFRTSDDRRGAVRTVELSAERRSLTTNTASIIITPGNGKAWLWIGRAARESVKTAALGLGKKVLEVCKIDISNIDEVAEGSEPSDLTDVLGGKIPSANYSSRRKRVYRCVDKGEFILEELHEFVQDELAAGSCCIVDIPFESVVYCWVGGDSKNELQKRVMELTVEYSKNLPPNENVSLLYLPQGCEPEEFKKYFVSWDVELFRKIPNESGFTKPTPIATVLKRYTRYISLELLQKRPLPDRVDPKKLEDYLSEFDFTKAFNMSRAEFLSAPKWKQLTVKKKAGLY